MKRTLGLVSNLEQHLPSDWWRTIFDATYLKTNGDIYENDNNTVREVDLLIQAANLDLDDNILDLCCGQGRHCLELARRGFKQVTGIDYSTYLIRHLQKPSKPFYYSFLSACLLKGKHSETHDYISL